MPFESLILPFWRQSPPSNLQASTCRCQPKAPILASHLPSTSEQEVSTPGLDSKPRLLPAPLLKSSTFSGLMEAPLVGNKSKSEHPLAKRTKETASPGPGWPRGRGRVPVRRACRHRRPALQARCRTAAPKASEASRASACAQRRAPQPGLGIRWD